MNFGVRVFDMIVKIPPKEHSLKEEDEHRRRLEALRRKGPWVTKIWLGRK